MIPLDCVPIGHRPPMPRIETSPQYTPAPVDRMNEHTRQKINQLLDAFKAKEDERLWELVVQSATGGRTA